MNPYLSQAYGTSQAGASHKERPHGIFAHNAPADRTWGECQARHSSMTSPWKRDHLGPKKICRSFEDGGRITVEC